MNDALYIAATGMQAQQLNVDNCGNDLGNIGKGHFLHLCHNLQDTNHQPNHQCDN